jgi:branched-chain amino acid transport system permease protein
VSFYIITLGVAFCSNAIFGLGLKLQYGDTGILNFAYIFFYAVGAYVAGAVATGSQRTFLANAVGEKFLWGLNVSAPYPLSLVIATIIGAAVAGVIGLTLLRTLSADFGALVTVAVFLVAYTVIGAYIPLFNGYQGLAAIPNPFGTAPSYTYLLCCVGVMLVAIGFTYAITSSPMGRRMRAVSQRPDVVEAMGKSVFRTRWTVFVIGNAMAALAGAMFVLFITGWAPPAWAFAETLTVYASVIIGGAGSNIGTLLGTAVVSVGIGQGVLFLPAINSIPYLIPSMQWVVIGLGLIFFIAIRPGGLIPERPRQLAARFTRSVARSEPASSQTAMLSSSGAA